MNEAVITHHCWGGPGQRQPLEERKLWPKAIDNCVFFSLQDKLNNHTTVPGDNALETCSPFSNSCIARNSACVAVHKHQHVVPICAGPSAGPVSGEVETLPPTCMAACELRV